jgi:hypothetical protein
MATSNVGTAIINFGVTYPGLNQNGGFAYDSTIPANVYCSAWITTDDSALGSALVSGTNHTHNDHAYAAQFIGIACEPSIAGVGFAILATSLYKFNGTFQVNWVWTDGI